MSKETKFGYGFWFAGIDVPYLLAPSSTDDDQIGFAAFVDWFYNRVLHYDVPVPFNFTSAKRWQSVFLQNDMPVKRVLPLGQDIDIGPEYHVLLFLEKEMNSEQALA